MKQPKYAAGRALRWIMSRREPILATLVGIDLGLVRQGQIKEPHTVSYSETKSKEAQELNAELMTKYSEMI